MTQTDYLPKTYEPIVPPKPPKEVIPTPIIYKTPKDAGELGSPPTPSPSPLPSTAASGGAGNGMIWCSGPQAPGWNVSLPNGGCEKPVIPVQSSTTGNPGVIRLDQLPYTGDNSLDIGLSALFYVGVVSFAIVGIHRVWRANFGRI